MYFKCKSDIFFTIEYSNIYLSALGVLKGNPYICGTEKNPKMSKG